MATFYFDVQIGGEQYRDEFGDAFVSLEEAVSHAQALLPDLARDHAFNEQNSVACELRNEKGQVVYRAELTFQSTNFYYLSRRARSYKRRG